jgi:hypothetical protein
MVVGFIYVLHLPEICCQARSAINRRQDNS